MWSSLWLFLTETTQVWVQCLKMARMELDHILVPLEQTFKSWSDLLDPPFPYRHVYGDSQACLSGISFIHSWL